jgi:hypothetical protein
MPILDMFRTGSQREAAAERRADAAYEKKIKELINPDEEYRDSTNDDYKVPKWFSGMVDEELPYKVDFTINWPDLRITIWMEVKRKLKDLDEYGKSRVNDPELDRLLDEVLEPVRDRFDFFVKKGKAERSENSVVDITKNEKVRIALKRLEHSRELASANSHLIESMPRVKRELNAALKAIVDPEPGQKSKKHIVRKLEKIKGSLKGAEPNIKEAIDVLLDRLAESSNVKRGGRRATRRNRVKRRGTRRT